MKQFLAFIGKIVLVLLLSSFALDFSYSYVYSKSIKRNKIENVINSEAKKYDVIMLGSSRANNHFVPQLFIKKGFKAYNYGMSGARLQESALMLQLMIDKGYSFKNIILETIQSKRLAHWNQYHLQLEDWAKSNNVKLPNVPEFATNNAHMFYLVCDSIYQRSQIINFLKQHQIHAVFHYISLHSSAYYESKHDGRTLTNSDYFSDCLLRLPMFYELDVNEVINALKKYE